MKLLSPLSLMLFRQRNSNDALLQQANAARDAKQHSQAALLYKQYINSNPRDVAIQIQCGHMFKEVGSLEQAGVHYTAALRLTPDDADLHLQLGHFHKVSGNLNAAIESYRKALMLDPGHADAAANLQDALSAAKTADPAYAATQKIVHLRQDTSSGCIGYVDSFDDGVIRGWAIDRRKPDVHLKLAVIVNGEVIGTAECSKPREDIRSVLGHLTGEAGFEYEVPLRFFDGKDHTLSLQYPGGAPVRVLTSSASAEESDRLYFGAALPDRFQGFVDGLRGGTLQGWIVRRSPRDEYGKGGCTVVVTCDGVKIGQVKADRWRGDVSVHIKADPNCGFLFAVPTAFRRARAQTFRFYVAPEHVELHNSPCVTSLVTDKLEAALLDAAAQVDRIHQELAALRQSLLLPAPDDQDTIENYDEWARRYFVELTRRAGLERQEAARQRADQPLVSVLVPTYRPLLTDFRAAVESVIAQTYANWELVIVDDASRDPELTEMISVFCARDKRIRSVTHDKNQNISEATNTAIQHAKGEWIAFFDHDDLLVDVALDMMIHYALRTDAEVLYSDEDKVDQAGYYSEPNFKPDWNHRYLLGCNYVCHLLIVRAPTLRKVGPLQTVYNGAQDHDLVLRLSETVSAERIHHVPEVLYHWRKTPNSTAVDISNKGYAVKAGVKAVNDHLDRVGTKAEVSSIKGLTIYRVSWAYEEQPTVCAIIPFREQIGLTRRCVQMLRKNTDWDKLEIILVDNGSTSQEAADFMEEARGVHGARVITVQEEFNFSRLNNIAAQATTADYLLFLNNDVFVEDRQWLRIMVNESLADPLVGIVGNKLFYPTGAVQHAGVVVGPSVIGMHVHRGAAETDYGYVGRALLPQEMTAVTAACMLVKAEVFQEGGGFDEVDLKVAYNDVDLCLKVRSRGLKVIYAADSTAAHHESVSRGSDEAPGKKERLQREAQVILDRWGKNDLFRNDPAYNPHFAPRGRGFMELGPASSIPDREVISAGNKTKET